MVITVHDLIEKFECTGKITLCGQQGYKEIWVNCDEAKKCGPFSPLVQILREMPPLLTLINQSPSLYREEDSIAVQL